MTRNYQSALPCDDESIRTRLAYAQYCYFFVCLLCVVIVGACHVSCTFSTYIMISYVFVRYYDVWLFVCVFFFCFFTSELLCLFAFSHFRCATYLYIYIYSADWTFKSVRQAILIHVFCYYIIFCAPKRHCERRRGCRIHTHMYIYICIGVGASAHNGAHSC